MLNIVQTDSCRCEYPSRHVASREPNALLGLHSRRGPVSDRVPRPGRTATLRVRPPLYPVITTLLNLDPNLRPAPRTRT